MTRFFLAALALLLAPAALAQSATSTDESLDLLVQIEGFAQIVSLDDQDGTADSDLIFDFAPGLDDADPTTGAPPAAVDFDDRIVFATNYATAQQVDIDVTGATAGDWNDLTITVTPGAISTINTSTSVAGAAGSCGTAGGAIALTADATDVPAASGITLCHATQLVNYSVELNSITADETDRAFDVTYTILATE